MRAVFGRVSALPTRSLSTAFANSSRSFPPNASSNSWVCERCHQQNQRTLYSKFLKIRQNGAKSETFKSRPSTLRVRRLSSDAQDEADKSRKDLPSQKEGRRSHISRRFSHLMDHLQSNIFIAGQRLNDLTGYSGIEVLKKDIEQQGQRIPYLCVGRHADCACRDTGQRHTYISSASSRRMLQCYWSTFQLTARSE